MKVKIITRLEEHISEELDKIVNDKEISKENKMEAFNVYYNTYQFLKDYDKNIKVLNNNLTKNKDIER